MTETGQDNFIVRDIKKAKKLVEKKEKLVKNPMARFNLNLDGQNQDWQPTPESGLKPLPPPVLSDKLVQELQSPERIEDQETGQKFNVIKANWELLGQEQTLVFLPPYNNAIEEGATHYRIQELARQIGRSTLAIDHPQMGNSDNLSKEQKQSLSLEADYGTIAEAELRIMQQLGIKEIDLVGQSMGAWGVAAIAERAEKYGIKVKNLIIVDAPGIEGIKPSQLTKAEFEESEYLDLYQTAPYDPEMRVAGGQNKNPVSKKVSFAKWALSSLRNDPKGVYRKAMARETLISSIRRALKSNPDLYVTNINGSLSRISTKESNSRLVRELLTEFPGRVGHAVFSGESHFVMESARRFASMTNRVLTGSFI